MNINLLFRIDFDKYVNKEQLRSFNQIKKKNANVQDFLAVQMDLLHFMYNNL